MSGTTVEVAPAPVVRAGRGLALPAAVAALVGSGAGLLYAVDPNQPGQYPGCPFLAVTGYWCPGCGSARALYALVHGDLPTALARNPIVPFVVVYLALSGLAWARRRVTGAPPGRFAPSWMLHVLWVGLTLFWVLRNVPGWTWLSPQ